ncbi:nucleoporin NUP42-like [Ischnura elegans]|uniref:nucleoporin NUP42-like n=1 Tax=Ischnura elegans TaxID=197161 RepID=UPI001ED88042|nr:nucleoporin NUP42-like [Ischnura elegans]
MVVCRFFLQGYCKFGDRCRYQHYQENRSPSPVSNYRGYNRSWHAPPQHEEDHYGRRANSPVSGGQLPLAASLNPLDLAEAIKEDVVAMEEGGQWPLTCYTPSKDLGCFPGFHDTSVEEVRYEAYQALSSGTFNQYIKKFESLMQATRMKWGMLKNPSGQVMSVIEKMASGQAVGSQPSSGLTSFSFTASFNSSSAPPTGSFSLGSNAAFGAPAFSSQPSQPSLPASNFTFSLDPQPSPPANSPFGSATTTATTPFGTAAFGMASPAPSFGQSGGMMFGGNSSGDIGQQQTTGTSSSVFFGSQQPGGDKQGPAFGSAHTSSPSGFGTSGFHAKTGSEQVAQNVYTPLGELSEAEQREFSAVTFTLGCIPLCPPPRELCV